MMKNDHITIHKKSDLRKPGPEHAAGHRQDAVRLPVKINRGFLNYAIDMSILASAVLCAVTGIAKWPGLVYSLGMSYDSLPMEAFTLVHDWMGLIVTALAVVHVLLHWRWLAAMTKRLLHANAGGDDHEKA